MNAHFSVEFENGIVGEIFRIRDESIENEPHAASNKRGKSAYIRISVKLMIKGSLSSSSTFV